MIPNNGYSHRPHHGETNEWCTPIHVINALGPFDDDPAIPGRNDGLDRKWKGFVWLNPPYSSEAGKWLDKLAEHGNGIALVFARTETRWFQRTVWNKASAVKFLYGRLHFVLNGEVAKGNSGAPSVLVAYGQEAVKRLGKSSLPGAFISNWR